MFDVQIDPVLMKPLTGRTHADLTEVGPSGSVASMAITKNAEIQQIQIRHTVGTGQFNIDIFSDASLTDPVFSATSDASVGHFNMNKLNLFFQNTDSPQVAFCYVKITPLLGSGHTFKIALFYNKN